MNFINMEKLEEMINEIVEKKCNPRLKKEKGSAKLKEKAKS